MELITKQGAALSLPKGYKQTEVGLIPEDWKLKTLGDVGDVQMCKRIFSYQTSKRGDVPFFKIGTFGKEPDAFIDWDLYQEFRKKYSFPKKGYLLISASGTIGRTVEYLGEDAYYQDSNIIWIDNDEKLISNKYLNYTLKVIKYNTEGSTIKRLYNSIIKSSKFVIPPTLTEQKAIATALSDIDALIANLEQTITKKKAIKQGAMQQLLTPPHKGGKRLPGFSGDWVEKTLGEVAEFYKGKGLPKSEISDDGKFKCLHYGELFTKYNELIDDVRSRTNFNDGSFMSKANDVLMPTSDVTPNGLATASVLFENDVILGGDVLVIRPNKSELFGGFLSYLVTINKQQILTLISGSTVYHLYGSDMAKFGFYLPRIVEQKAIVQILSDMDAEITQLESKKEKYQAIKQGMMQELLTGKTRLI